MLAVNIILSSMLILFKSANCIFSDIEIIPNLVILNSTTSNTIRLICAKKTTDSRLFVVNVSPNISSEYIRISTNRSNDTAIEINIQSFDYIGAFSVICSSIGEKSADARAKIFIGKPPILLHRAKRCIVYYDKYIDCTIRAPEIIQAMNNGLEWTISFNERPLPFQPKIYREQPKLVQIDNINKTLTYRWFPIQAEKFPSAVKMNVIGTINHFGTAYHKMDMTPNFLISSNFTVDVVSSTDLRIEFNHGNYSSLSLCHGNLTRDDTIDHSNQRENIRTFVESNQTIIHVTGLRSNTWYQICFHCRRTPPKTTISEVQCYRSKTLKDWALKSFVIIIIIFSCLIFFTVILLIKNQCRIKEKLRQQRRTQVNVNGENIALTETSAGLSECIPH